MKTCKRCGYVGDDFPPKRRVCWTCHRARTREYQREYRTRPEAREKAMARHARWRAANREVLRVAQRRWYWAKPEARRAAARDWYARNRERVLARWATDEYRAYQRARYAQRKAARLHSKLIEYRVKARHWRGTQGTEDET